MTHWVPELLAPAGNLEKLKVAVSYGANAVYLAGQKFGLRSAADNFTTDELIEGIAFAHAHRAKVFLVLNSFLHDDELATLPEFLHLLEQLKVDAVIVSDLGVIEVVKANCQIPIHLSTQATCLNTHSALLWKAVGVARIVLGREVSIKEAKKIKEVSGLEIEMFVHGSMCMAYSGNCVISNYTQGRDSNRGGCAHSCRFAYAMEMPGLADKEQTYFMSSKDLQGIGVLAEFIAAGIDSLKVEGRMKGHHYAGTISKVYAEALSSYAHNGSFSPDHLWHWESELNKVTHREYTAASLLAPADEQSIYNQRENDQKDYVVAGMVLEVVPEKFILLEVRHHFFRGDHLELLPFRGPAQFMQTEALENVYGEEVEKTRPGSLVKLPYNENAKVYNLVRKKVLL